jgi:hypothetical protein
MTAHRGTTGGARVALVLVLAVLASGCASATPPAPQPTATAAPTSTLNPDEAAAAAALAAFGAITQRDDLTYHLAQTTALRVNGEWVGKVVNGLDVNGPDFAVTLTAAGKTMRVVYVDGVTWTKVGKQAWKKGVAPSAAAVTDVLDTWSYLGPLDGLAYAGRNRSDPANLDFTNSSQVPYQTTAMREEGMQGVIDELTLTLAPDGTPVALRFHAIGSYTSGALADRRVSMDSTIAITRFGEAIVVKPPK